MIQTLSLRHRQLGAGALEGVKARKIGEHEGNGRGL